MRNVENMGKLKHGYYSEAVEKISSELRGLREKMKRVPKNERKSIQDDIAAKKAEMTEMKETELAEMAKVVGSGKAKFKISLKEIKEHDTFVTDDINALIISQIIKQELRRYYKLEPANRDMIIEQLIGLLDNPMPKTIIRADICHFFESIPQDRIIKKLAEDGYLSKRTLKYLKGMLFRCNELQGNSERTGIPRGLAFSSYLSELYMKTVDAAIQKMKGIYFYKRYVDDIIIIANPSKATVEEYWQAVSNLLKEKSLDLHEDSKKKYMAVFDGATEQKPFDYLGYMFSYASDRLSVGMAEKKYSKYIILIDAIFDIYSRCANYRKGKEKPIGSRQMRNDALHQLIARIRTLTSNGYLSGRKNYVSTGIYYSNKYVTDFGQLTALDRYLASKIDDGRSFCPPASLFNYSTGNGYNENMEHIRQYLHRFTFMSGFRERRVYKKGHYSRTLIDLQHIYHSRLQ